MLEFWDGIEQTGELYKKLSASGQKTTLAAILKSSGTSSTDKRFIEQGPKGLPTLLVKGGGEPIWPFKVVWIP
jgi:hypothetical protein